MKITWRDKLNYYINFKPLCKLCLKIWTAQCPIRVWGRNENQEMLRIDVDPNRDYCSKFSLNKSFKI